MNANQQSTTLPGHSVPDWFPEAVRNMAALAEDHWQDTRVTYTVTGDDIDRYAAVVGDYQPLHMSDEAARKAGFARRIAHGHLVLGLTGRLIPLAQLFVDQGISIIRVADDPTPRYRCAVLCDSIIQARIRLLSCYSGLSRATVNLEYQVVLTLSGEVVLDGGQLLVCTRRAK